MPTLAIAGGTSPSLGRAITTALLSPKSPLKTPWTALILSRSTNPPLWLRSIDPTGTRTKILAVDYLSPDSLTSALQGVDTVVSVTSAVDGTQAQIQKNLLHAAVRAGCRRFAPGQWGFGLKGYESVGAMKWGFDGVWEECGKFGGRIECGRFNQGMFMNYIGLGMFPMPRGEMDEEVVLEQMRVGGGYAEGEDEACQGLMRQGDLKDGSGGAFIGLKNGIAELPVKDDGSWPRVTMTTLRDVGRFFVASLELSKWEEDMSMVGDTVTMGELLAHAEEVTGRKFQVTKLKQADLVRKLEGEIAPDDFMGRFWTEFKLACTRDEEDEVVLRPVVNRLCPSVQPMGVRQYMETFWKTT